MQQTDEKALLNATFAPESVCQRKPTMKSSFLSVLFLGTLCLPAHSATIKMDSVPVLNFKDTVFLMVNSDGQKFFNYAIQPRQTLFGISKSFGMSVDETLGMNPELSSEDLKVGTRIRISVPEKALKRFAGGQPPVRWKFVPVCYRMKKGETLIRVASKYKINVDSLATANNLNPDLIAPGQVLTLGWLSVYGINTSMRTGLGAKWRRNFLLKRKYDGDKASKTPVGQRGLAVWLKDGPRDEDQYCLHRDAPIGSILEINNPLTNYKVYAKVSGKIPDAIYDPEVLIVVSSQAANLLGAKDPRFFVRVEYLR